MSKFAFSLTLVIVTCHLAHGQLMSASESASRSRPLALQHGAPWPKFRGNVANTGQGTTGGSTGVLKWKFGTKGIVASSPAIASDGTIYFGSFDSNLYAIDRAGVQKWSYPTGNVIWGSPAIGTDGTIYYSSEDSNLYAINPDGSKKWVYAAGGTLSSSPTVGTDGTIYVGCWDNNLYAISSTGAKKWTYPTGNLIGSSPAIGSDGTVYVGSTDGSLYAVKADGTLRWKFSAQAAVSTSPSVGPDGIVYFGSNDGDLYAVKPDGTEKWHYSVGSPIVSSPAVGIDGTIYFGSNDFNLYSLTSGGQLNWSYPTGLQISSSPVIGSDGTVYVGSQDHNLYAINSSGTLRWSQSTHAAVVSTPAIDADGTLYIGSNDQNLYAFGTQVNTIPVSSFNLSPASVAGGTSAVGTVTLQSVAPSNGDVVTLLSSDASVNVPSFVVVPGGANSTTFTLLTSPVLANKTVTVTASSGGTNVVSTMVVTTGPISNLAISPSSVVIGQNAFGTVTVSSPAPVGGTVISLSSANPNAIVPATVTVAQGATTANFTIQTSQVNASLTAVITASIGNYSRQATLKLLPTALQGVTLSSNSAVSGDTLQATATLNGPAPAAGVIITWTSNSTALVPPKPSKILKGTTSITIPVKVGVVNQNSNATLSASYASSTQSADVSIDPLVVTQVLLNSQSLSGGASTTGTVELNGNGNGSATKVNLTSSNPAVIVPVSILVPANSKLVTFVVKTTPVPTDRNVVITATTLTQPKTVTVTVTAPTLSLMTVNPTAVSGGATANGTVSITSFAPVGGITISLSSPSAYVTVPSSVTIPAGKSFSNFVVKTSAVSDQQVVSITGTLNGHQTQTNLVVNPPALTSLTISPSSVKGGTTATGKVTLSSIAPVGGMVVTLAAQGVGGSVPASVTILAGKTTATFAVATKKVSSKSNLLVTGTLGPVQKNSVLTIQ